MVGWIVVGTSLALLCPPYDCTYEPVGDIGGVCLAVIDVIDNLASRIVVSRERII